LLLYTFADNHDVARIATQLHDKRHLPLVYALLYAMPGIPSVYYGSEFGIEGAKQQGSDANLRPALDIAEMHPEQNPLTQFLYRLGAAYEMKPALHTGSFRTVEVRNQQLEICRGEGDDAVYCVLNLSDQPSGMPLPVGGDGWYDLLTGERIEANGGVTVPAFTAMWIAKATPEELHRLNAADEAEAAPVAVTHEPEPQPAEPEQPAAEEIPAAPAEMTAAELVWKLSLLDRCMTREKLSEAFGREPEDKQEGSNVVYEYQFDGGVTLRLWGDPVLRAALQYNDRAFEILL
ncbi:MAG: alpha-glucosidase C-terminal domain-containing protein, partial [Oscillospiraceae bacterium]|nr:alpha-glucosidase C-terminal domain-containing protein [Oscillospiraceae bacterium]